MNYNREQFWFGISLLIKNYHAINKQIFSCVIENVNKIPNNIKQTYDDCIYKSQKQQPAESQFEAEMEVTQGCTKETYSNETEMFKILDSNANQNVEGFQIEMTLLKKTDEPDIKVKSIINFLESSYSSFFDSDILDDFVISFNDGNVDIKLLSNKLNSKKSEEWLDNNLKAKFLKWLDNTENLGCEKKIPSLSLIDHKRYNNLYKELKKKYSHKALKLWSEAGESTDPLKFVYEDLAIAAYLITLWRDYENGVVVPKAFADLGCGNGLLVYILTEEGYSGYGYDIRARKLWSLYPKEVKLIEAPVIPNDFIPPDEVDWLIGNHSDELSAWLPVMTSLVSYNCRYFVLPCCAYEFSGKKYQRRDCKQSVYQDFLLYVENVSQVCGFVTLKDRLKIPSTKRIALIGLNRYFDKDHYPLKRKEIENFLKQEQLSYPADCLEGTIKIRNKEEPVKNCTKVDPLVISNLVLKIFHLLLDSEANLEFNGDNDINWRSGGRLQMKHIVQHLDKNDLQKIKAECGGIKTLLRNKHEIFEFCGGDLIGIRKPIGMDSYNLNKKSRTTKKRSCFFKEHHPDGCPLSDENCTFIH